MNRQIGQAQMYLRDMGVFEGAFNPFVRTKTGAAYAISKSLSSRSASSNRKQNKMKSTRAAKKHRHSSKPSNIGFRYAPLSNLTTGDVPSTSTVAGDGSDSAPSSTLSLGDVENADGEDRFDPDEEDQEGRGAAGRTFGFGSGNYDGFNAAGGTRGFRRRAARRLLLSRAFWAWTYAVQDELMKKTFRGWASTATAMRAERELLRCHEEWRILRER